MQFMAQNPKYAQKGTNPKAVILQSIENGNIGAKSFNKKS